MSIFKIDATLSFQNCTGFHDNASSPYASRYAKITPYKEPIRSRESYQLSLYLQSSYNNQEYYLSTAMKKKPLERSGGVQPRLEIRVKKIKFNLQIDLGKGIKDISRSK